MATYLRERDYDYRDSLPSIRTDRRPGSGFNYSDPSGRKVTFGDGILRHRSASPGRQEYRSESPHFQPRPPSPGRRTILEVKISDDFFISGLESRSSQCSVGCSVFPT